MLRLCLPISLLIVVAACATPQDIQNLQSKMARLERRQQQTVQTRIQGLEQKFASLEEETSHLVSNRTENMRSHQANLWSELENMRVDVATLQGKAEQMEYNIKKLQDQSSNNTQTLDNISRTVNRLSRQLAMVESQLGVDFEDGQSKAAQPSQSSKENATQKQDTPQLLYEQALNAFQNREYTQAKELWAEFAGQFPDHDLVPNAYFWQGECLYQLEKYAQAVMLYNKVISEFPKSSKFTSALLKQGLSLYALDKNKAGRIRLQQLIKDHGDTAEAKRAKRFMEQQ
ncbi:tol-pal system protein YbgF [Desulfovermiculus halophilus]|uniref:tol-pal system protein YbgF n=1 Tax=Desulfovermiculus halophilus TaxID=339722 RepID=UPI00048636FA|nr:tol-pal system protein YbgF [Desulfovermiculus halophilus]